MSFYCHQILPSSLSILLDRNYRLFHVHIVQDMKHSQPLEDATFTHRIQKINFITKMSSEKYQAVFGGEHCV